MTATIFPARYGEIEVRFGITSPAHAVYVRRRLAVALVLAALVALLGLGAHTVLAHTVLADRGGVPASTTAIRPASSALAAAQPAPAGVIPVAAPVLVPAAITYVVQPGDTLWSLAEQFRGGAGMSHYVDMLVSANGGSVVQPGQVLVMP